MKVSFEPILWGEPFQRMRWNTQRSYDILKLIDLILFYGHVYCRQRKYYEVTLHVCYFNSKRLLGNKALRIKEKVLILTIYTKFHFINFWSVNMNNLYKD